MDMARFEIPVSGWTCFRTETGDVSTSPSENRHRAPTRTLVDVGRVGLLSRLGALLLLAGGGGLLAGILLLGSLGRGRGGLRGGLLVGLGGHFEILVLCCGYEMRLVLLVAELIPRRRVPYGE